MTLNAVGAILRGFAEFHQDVFDRARLVVVDNVANVRSISAEFIDRYANGVGDWEQVRPWSEVVAAARPRLAPVAVSRFLTSGNVGATSGGGMGVRDVWRTGDDRTIKNNT